MDENYDVTVMTIREQRMALEEAKYMLMQQPYRRVGDDPANSWCKRWLAFVARLLIFFIPTQRIERLKSNDTIEYLLRHNLIDFRDENNRDEPVVPLSADLWWLYLNTFPDYFLIIFEKSAPFLTSRVHYSLVKDIFVRVKSGELLKYSHFAVKVVEISLRLGYFDFEFHTDDFKETIQKCRSKTLSLEEYTYVYTEMWKTIYHQMPSGLPSEIYIELMNQSAITPRDEHLLNCSPECYILGAILHRNPFKNTPRIANNHKTAILSFWDSLNVWKLNPIFEQSEPVMRELYDAIKYIFKYEALEVKKVALRLIKGFCQHSMYYRGIFLRLFVNNIQEHLENKSNNNLEEIEVLLEMYAMLCQQSGDLEEYIYDKWNRVLSISDKGSKFKMVVTLNRARYPGRCKNDTRVRQLLAYGVNECFGVANNCLFPKQCLGVATFFRLNTNSFDDGFYQKGYEEETLAGINWTSLSDFYYLIAELCRAQIVLHHEELILPAQDRTYLHPQNGLKLFKYAVEYALDLFRTPLSWNISTYGGLARLLTGARYPTPRFPSLVVDWFADGEVPNEVKLRMLGRPSNIQNYFNPCLDVFRLCLEVLDLDYFNEVVFPERYIPYVKNLLLIFPLEALKLIVVYCRAYLKLNLTCSYPHTSEYQADWSRARSFYCDGQKTLEYFQKFPRTPEEVYSRTIDLEEYESITLFPFVTAVVNHFSLHDEQEVTDYLTIQHYFDILKAQNITSDVWKVKTAEEAKDILFNWM